MREMSGWEYARAYRAWVSYCQGGPVGWRRREDVCRGVRKREGQARDGR